METSAKDKLKAHLPTYLTARGIPLGRPFCCLNPSHPDRHPSMRYDPRREAVHCFSCGADYDVFDLVGIDYGLDSFPEQAEKAAALFSVTVGTPPMRLKKTAQEPMAGAAAYLDACHARAAATEYFARRGIGATSIDKFRLGYDPAYAQGTGGQTWQAVLLPTGPESFTARNTDPAASDKHRIRKQGEAAFLGFREALAACSEAKSQDDSSPSSALDAGTARLAACGDGQSCFLVEGEFDALSLWEIGMPAISLGSVANTGKFLRQLAEAFPERAGDDACRPAFLLSLDRDDAGQRASAELLEGLRDAGFRAYAVDICGDAKDPNEALVRDRARFCAAVAEAARTPQREAERAKKAYLSNSSAGYLDAFVGGIAEGARTEALRTGFPALDAQLDGGLYEGLYIIGAISSLGKTTLLLQIADQLAQRGQDVLLFTLEMARFELMAKSVSRHTLELCLAEGLPTALAKTGRGITAGKRYAGYSGEENHLITRAVQAYDAYAEHLFLFEGVGDIGVGQVREAVRRHIELTGNTPVVMVDYLQILAPHNERATDKQNTDRAVLELKRLSRDHKLPVLAISSFNRANYAAPVTMEAFKESGAIEYSSDVLIGLQLKGAGTPDFDATLAKQQNPRKVELIILKNRNGATGGRLAYNYYPLFNSFVEAAGGRCGSTPGFP